MESREIGRPRVLVERKAGEIEEAQDSSAAPRRRREGGQEDDGTPPLRARVEKGGKGVESGGSKLKLKTRDGEAAILT